MFPSGGFFSVIFAVDATIFFLMSWSVCFLTSFSFISQNLLIFIFYLFKFNLDCRTLLESLFAFLQGFAVAGTAVRKAPTAYHCSTTTPILAAVAEIIPISQNSIVHPTTMSNPRHPTQLDMLFLFFISSQYVIAFFHSSLLTKSL